MKISKSIMESRKLLIVLFIVVALFYWIGLYLYMPILPIYIQSRVNNLAAVGTILSMFGLWQLVMRLPTGIAADLTGHRKPFIIAGLVLVSAGAWILGVATNDLSLLLGRSITGIAAATWVPLIVAFSTLFKPNEAIHATAILTLVGTVGRILATALSGFVTAASGGYHLAFQLAGIIALAGALLMIFLPDASSGSVQTKDGKGILMLCLRPDVLLPALMNAVIQYGDWSTTFSFIPILAKNLGASDVLLSTLLTFNMVIMALGNFIAASLNKRFNARGFLLLSFITLVLGIVLASISKTLVTVFLAQGFIGLSIGIGYPIMMGLSINKVNGEERTVAMGLHQSIYAIGMFAGPWMSGILADSLGISRMFLFTALIILFLGLFLARLYLHRSKGTNI